MKSKALPKARHLWRVEATIERESGEKKLERSMLLNLDTASSEAELWRIRDLSDAKCIADREAVDAYYKAAEERRRLAAEIRKQSSRSRR